MQCMQWLFYIIIFSFTYNIPHFAAGRCYRGRGLIDSTAESTNYMLTYDSHVVGVMSLCESIESGKLLLWGMVKIATHSFSEFLSCHCMFSKLF